jgi:phage tail protein X
MNRYTQNDSNVFKRYDGKRVLRTTRYPKIPVGFNDIYIVASETDYLDSLAYKYYQDTTLWWVIAQANGIKASLKAPTGEQIRIPQNIENIVLAFKRENSI